MYSLHQRGYWILCTPDTGLGCTGLNQPSNAMQFITMSKKDWRMILHNSSTCEEVLEEFQDVVSIKTLDNWGVDNGKHWESHQNVVTAQLLR